MSNEASETLLELDEVHKSYGAPDSGGVIDVLTGVSLTVRHGDAIAVEGPSGSGKSTLLNIMGALDTPDSGRVLFRGTDMAGYDESERAELRNRSIGFVFQLHHLLPQCSALENVMVPTMSRYSRASSRSERPARTRAVELLERVGLADRVGHRPGELSGGERLRVAVARALVNEPAVLLADEPTGSLDSETSESIADLLLELNQDTGIALVVVTHASFVAGKCRDRYVLRNGIVSPAPGEASRIT